MKEILINLYEQYSDAPNTQELVAAQLGVTQPTVSLWVKLAGLTPKTVLA